MRITSKHDNQQTISMTDFTGGLNTSSTDEMIADNQLHETVNMEIDKNSGLLRTVQGTINLYKLAANAGYRFKSAAYDVLNDTLLIFTDDKQILATQNFTSVRNVGTLTGDHEVIAAMWENGLLIASGGKLQYAIGTSKVTTIINSPDYCNGVYIRSGRVMVFDKTDTIQYSGVGDETNWTQDNNDPSAALFAQIGYKVGGKIIGMVNLSKDILFIKSNGMVFRLENEYPDWRISELGRNIFCKGYATYCNIGDRVLILGNTGLQVIETTQDYGDMKPSVIGNIVQTQINSIPAGARLRYVPPLNQVWCISGNDYVLIFDCNTNSFYQRYFNSNCVDVISIDNTVYVIKSDAVTKLDDSFNDDGQPMVFKAVFKTSVPLNQFLIKKIALSILPLTTDMFYDDAHSVIHIGKISLVFPPRRHNDAYTGNSILKLNAPANMQGSSFINPNNDDVFLNPEYITPSTIVLVKSRILYRDSKLRINMEGTGFPFILNYIKYDIVEV